MASKFQILVVAALAFSALAVNDSKFDKVVDPAVAKDVAIAFDEALKEEEPSLKEQQKDQGLKQQPVVRTHLRAVKDSSVAPTVVPQLSAVIGDGTSAFEKDVTDLVTGLSKGRFGATPMGESVKKIADLIENEMMPQVKAAHTANQEELNKLAKELVTCGSTKTSQLYTAGKKKTTYLSSSTSHKSCRGEEASLYTENVECHTEWKADRDVKNLECKAYSDVSKKYGDSNANKNIVSKGGSEDVETYVMRITDTICGKDGKGMLADLLKHKLVCEKATKKFNAITKECKDLDKKWHNKRKECNNIQDSMDDASCKWAIDSKDACESYAECYTAKKEAYGDAEVMVKKEEKDRKAEWKGLKRMKCLIDAFGDGTVAAPEIEACKKAEHSTDLLIIAYPPLPDLVGCSVPLLYPATAEYKKAEFTPLPVLAKGKADANECTGVNEISTTPADGSPASCKCERVTVNGPFSGGSVVKCTNCLDVARSKDKISCPAGTKLFSPQSREDWATFIKSAPPLGAPNWIIDVTRPQNGCGGCTSYNMNSKTTQQQSWVTSDGSPWWLRSSRYSEPNGDYHANCYLDLWRTPSSADSVTFNDGSCSYHSKSYYCQSIKFSSEPKAGSPTGCSCKKVELNGDYSAQFLFKCENCLDVYKSNDKNSCPSGTKLFAPASKQDWKTFIASATPLRAPHWIVDVTRPQNGCGGCTREAMNSGNAVQATWKTADGSPWWLRSTTYGEPNGDYTANCYLDLWRTPANENSVTFNDGSCHYHARSYYCQSVAAREKKAPTTTLPPWKDAESWKLVLKTSGDATFGYSSKYWENDELLNANADEAAPGDAKYAAFTSVPFSKIKMCIGKPDGNCVEHKFSRDYANTKALFSAGYIKDPNLDQKGILKVFGPKKGSYQVCPPQRPGFNIKCNDGNWARWGFCANCQSEPCQNSDNHDADAAIGIGLRGESTPGEMGAGWTNYFASGKGTCSANSKTAKQVWVYVFENTML